MSSGTREKEARKEDASSSCDDEYWPNNSSMAISTGYAPQVTNYVIFAAVIIGRNTDLFLPSVCLFLYAVWAQTTAQLKQN